MQRRGWKAFAWSSSTLPDFRRHLHSALRSRWRPHKFFPPALPTSPQKASKMEDLKRDDAGGREGKLWVANKGRMDLRDCRCQKEKKKTWVKGRVRKVATSGGPLPWLKLWEVTARVWDRRLPCTAFHGRSPDSYQRDKDHGKVWAENQITQPPSWRGCRR